MKRTKLVRRTGLLEHVCEHGVGHPDEESVAVITAITGQDSWDMHGCDGCCSREDFPGRSDEGEGM